MLIRIQDLRFRYPQSTFEISIPDFELKQSERLFIFGPSGSGKSTFLNLVCGLLSAQGGSLEFGGRNLSSLRPSQRDQLRSEAMGCIFQSFNLLPYLTVLENILLPYWNSSSRWRSQKFKTPEDEATELARRLDLLPDLKSASNALSIGQQQRVAAARAFMGAPKLIIADEPTSALDSDRQDTFVELLNELASEHSSAILFVSHNQSLAKHFDRKVSIFEILKEIKA